MLEMIVMLMTTKRVRMPSLGSLLKRTTTGSRKPLTSVRIT